MTLSLASPGPIGYSAAKMHARRSVGILASWARVASVAVSAVSAVSAGCTPATDTSTTVTSVLVGNPTVSVDPAVFLGDSVPCTAQPGGMQSYVATITDVGPLGADGTPAPSPYPIALPSSPPTSCSQSVYFAAVVDHHYEAVIDGYEEATGQLVPVCSATPAGGPKAPAGGGLCTVDSQCFALGCYGRCVGPDATTDCAALSAGHPACQCIYTPALGDRHMLAPGTSKLVAPRWRTRADEPCGYGTSDVAVAYTNVSITPCAPLLDGKPGSTTGLEIIPHGALGTYGCAASDTVSVVVTKVDIIPDPMNPIPLAKVAGLACGGTYTYSPLPADRDFSFELDGYQKGDATRSLTAVCRGRTVKGLVVAAACDPFVPSP